MYRVTDIDNAIGQIMLIVLWLGLLVSVVGIVWELRKGSVKKASKIAVLIFIIAVAITGLFMLWLIQYMLCCPIKGNLTLPRTYEVPSATSVTSTGSPLPVVSPAITSLEIPSLPVQFQWIQEDGDKTIDLSCLVINYSDSRLLCKDFSIPLAATGWVSKQNGLEKQNLQEQMAIFRNYIRSIENLGWKEEAVVDNLGFSFGHGDGPFASTGGLVATNGIELRGLQYGIFYQVARGSDPSDFDCPCSVKFSVSLSEKVPISSLMGSKYDVK